ncbi:hypothetical protein T484DRAFT_1787468 [Baffinella frigidus]|nr:hypothetical protein T484DRAFT_1787468 [Cryptophyta sp. CCMP2293]
MRALALLALLVAPCGAFFHGAAPGWGLAPRGGGAQLTGEIKECRELGELARILQEQSGMLNRIHVSAAWVCLARIGRGGGAESTVVLTSLQDQTREVLDQMGAREIANMMYSIGRISQIGIKPDRELLEAIQTRATATVGEFIPQHVANVMWALATMGEKADRGLLTAMQTRATATAVEFAPQAVSNLVWALATMGEKADRGLLEAMQSRATATAGEFKPQEGTNLLWALAKMGERADLWLLEAMQRRATATAGEFVPQDVANLLWALATMRERADRGLLMAMVVRATARAENFKPQEVSNLLWSLAAMGEKADRGLLDAMQTRATSTVERFKPQEVANLLWALATMGEKVDPGLLEAMQRRATSIAGGFKPQEVTNMLWALAVMGGGLDGSLAVLVDCLAPRILELRDQFTQAENSQLHQWLLSCELGLASGASLPEGVARVKLEIGEECLQAFSGQATHESRLQRDVATALKRCAGLEVEIEEEFHDARSGYSIDVLVRRRSAAGSTGGAKALEEPAAGWAVEVDGPSHFLVDGRTPNGSTILKRRQLEQLGYTVVPVPFLEWQALRGEEAQKGYLEDKLRRASMVD